VTQEALSVGDPLCGSCHAVAVAQKTARKKEKRAARNQAKAEKRAAAAAEKRSRKPPASTAPPLPTQRGPYKPFSAASRDTQTSRIHQRCAEHVETLEADGATQRLEDTTATTLEMNVSGECSPPEDAKLARR